MKCLQVDTMSGKTHPIQSSFNIRMSYLLANSTYVVGSSGYFIFFEIYFQQLPLKRKLGIMRATHLQQNNAEVVELIDTYFSILKKKAAMKHPPQNIFAIYMQMENAINKLLKDWIEAIKKDIEGFGLSKLIELVSPKVLEVYAFNDVESEEENVYINKSSIFQKKFKDFDVGEVIWLLPQNFFREEVFSPDEELDTDIILESTNPYFIKAFEFANINILSITELQAIRSEFAEPLQQIQKELQQWALSCRVGSGRNHLAKHVIPLLNQLNDCISNNALLQRVAVLQKNIGNQCIYLAEVDYSKILKYYYAENLFAEEEYNFYVSEYEKQEPYNVPILVYSDSKHKLFTTDDNDVAKVDDNEEQQLVQPKKSIIVDEN